MPFANAYERAIHFAKHGHEFGASTELDYEHMADMFLNRPMTITTRECLRPTGCAVSVSTLQTITLASLSPAPTPSSPITLFRFTESIGVAA